MVAKKTAVQQSASGSSTGPAAKDVGGKKSAQAAPAEAGTGAKPVKNASGKAARPTGASAAAESAGTATEATGKAAAAKTAAKKVTAKKATARKTTARKAVDAKSAGKKVSAAAVAPGETEPAKGAGTQGAITKRAGAKRAAKKSSGTAKKAVASAAQDAAEAAKTTGATTVVAKKTPGTATAAKKPGPVPKARVSAVVVSGELAVRPGEDPWTPEEAAEARAELQSEALRLSSEISSSEAALAGLMRDSGDGAGDDQADTGTKNITRESEMALNANAREMLEQTERALQRLDAGTYGLCENCGNPIGKARMQAFPRATLCVECKQKQERRY
ncbi:TraR/DksA C4-type zinc finger protein [Streptomyces sp. NPDC088747]|uniref:TraR/DksA family transcriptional regulator n=1 Tax=Streptomyces sp. NPDC088747 TaxID=3365886 RepID=UPI00381BF8E3